MFNSKGVLRYFQNIVTIKYRDYLNIYPSIELVSSFNSVVIENLSFIICQKKFEIMLREQFG